VQVIVFSTARIPTTTTSSIDAIFQGVLDFDHCTFQDNEVSYAGGALYLRGSGGSSRLTNCFFRNNTATHESILYVIQVSE
jgi:hypothetical protein